MPTPIYSKYVKSIAKDFKKVLELMTDLNIHETIIKKDQRPENHYPLSYSIKFKHLTKNIRGIIYFSFNDIECANAVARSIASKIGGDEVPETRDDYLTEFINTAVGTALNTLDEIGFSASFEPPVIIKNSALDTLSFAGESSVIVMALDISHLFFKIVFIDNLFEELIGKKILVVDDSLMIRNILKSKLSKVGFKVEMACDGMEGIERFKSFQPDIILMDQVMPNLKGLDAIEEIQKLAPKVKFIMLSSTHRKDEVERARTLNVVRYLTKPINFTELYKAVAIALLKKKNSEVTEDIIIPTIDIVDD